jgi:hypothetical protein
MILIPLNDDFHLIIGKIISKILSKIKLLPTLSDFQGLPAWRGCRPRGIGFEKILLKQPFRKFETSNLEAISKIGF